MEGNERRKKNENKAKTILPKPFFRTNSLPHSNESNNKTSTKKAQVAQLVEQLAFNQLVLGSNPSLRTNENP